MVISGPSPVFEPLPALDRVLHAARARYTGREAAALAGVEPEWAARVWRAAGFDGDFDARDFSPDDVAVLQAAADLMADGRVAPGRMLQLARMFNLAAAPLADAAAATVTDDEWGTLEDFDEGIATFERVVLHAWRRRLLRALDRGRGTEQCRLGIGFVDLVGFTGLVRQQPDRWLHVLDRLEEGGFEIVARHGGQVIKTIGDELMFANPDAAATVATCQALLDGVGDHGLPPLRVGAAYGAVVITRGDRFGEPVNLASRLVRLSRPGRALLDPALVAAAEVDAAPGWPRRLKGIGWVRPVTLRPTPALELA